MPGPVTRMVRDGQGRSGSGMEWLRSPGVAPGLLPVYETGSDDDPPPAKMNPPVSNSLAARLRLRRDTGEI